MELKFKRDIAIVGNGNVAIDIARILLKKTEDLINTEISPKALNSLKDSNIKNVTLIGRRGLIQSAFALK
jgi:NADPH-dependent glutamate synthase beta subunit-like oxidoreductase